MNSNSERGQKAAYHIAGRHEPVRPRLPPQLAVRGSPGNEFNAWVLEVNLKQIPFYV